MPTAHYSALTICVLTASAVASTPPPVELTPSSPIELGEFASAVALTETHIAVSAMAYEGDEPAVLVYDARSLALLHVLRASPDAPADELFGIGLGLDGDRLIVGASAGRGAATSPGAAYLFDPFSGEMLARIAPSHLETGDAFGAAVAIHGSLALIGAPGEDENFPEAGRVYSYDIADAANPVEVNRTQPPLGDGPFSLFGSKIDMSGTRAAVADEDRIHMFFTTGGAIGNAYATLTEPNKTTGSNRWGYSMDLDGQRLLVGSHRNQSGIAGTAYLYNVGFTPSLLSTFRPDANGEISDFGYTVALDGDTAVIGAPNDSRSYYNSGAVYTFDLSNPANPVQTARLERDVPLDFDLMAEHVAVRGDTIVAGGSLTNVGDIRSGAVLVFDTTEPCGVADFAAPFGVLDLSDLSGFITAYTSGDPAGDVNGDGVYDLGDITAFVNAFTAGCP